MSQRWRVRIAFGALVLGAGVGYAVALPFETRPREKLLSGLEISESAPGLPATDLGGPLPIRLIDMGGVGIPADTSAWGSSYSHATHAFDQLILEEAPWIDPVGADRIRADWRRYVERMSAMGSNAVVLDAFLEVLNFDRIGNGHEIYRAGDPLRHRHLAYRTFFDELVADAGAVGMDVYLKTDLPVVTPALGRHLARIGDDASTPEFWSVYGAGLDELFEKMPDLAGVVVRIGEAGPLYQADGVEYSSYMGVRTPADLQMLLRTLLPVFERHGKTMIFRTWSVGLGPLGDLHNDPALFEQVLGSIQSDALIVSTKFVQGDYFGFLPLNPTLLVGEQQRIIEYQARREFEGFGALPNYLGHAHAASLRQALAANSRIVGTSLWAQEGGPLRAGPLSLYDVAGFWRWTDANVYATTRLALEPGADPRVLAEDWARSTFGDDPIVARAMGHLLLTSREALETGFYIRPYAEQRIEVVGVEAPPILWIFEWDVLAGWSSVLAALYGSVAADVETPIAEGFEALGLTATMRSVLLALEPRIGAHPDFPLLLASVDYQASLFAALADYRESFLRYYAWLDRGGDPSAWRAAARRFQITARAHMERYGEDLDFPAFDFAPALRATDRALAAGPKTQTARALTGALLVTFLLGGAWFQRRTPDYPGKSVARLIWMGASRPSRLLDRVRTSRWAAWAPPGAVLVGVVAAVSLLLADSVAVATGIVVLGIGYSGTLALSWQGATEETGSWAAASSTLGPLLLGSALVLSVIAIRGPDYFWFLFWSEIGFRTAVFGTAIALGLWAIASSHWMGHALSGGRTWFAGGSVLAAGGVMLLVLSGLLPDLEGTLAALDDPFQLLPMRRAIINGITHYAGVPGDSRLAPALLGGALLLVGLTVRGRDRPAQDAAGQSPDRGHRGTEGDAQATAAARPCP
jgi:hypothetical protein